MPIVIKQENLFESNEKNICCIASCCEKVTARNREPNLTQFFEKFPFSNAYSEFKKTGKRWKNGTVKIYSEKQKVFVIFSRLYPGISQYPGDSTQFRQKWFSDALTSLIEKNSDLQTLAFDKGFGYLDGGENEKIYYDLLEDFIKIYQLRTGNELTVNLYEYPEQILPEQEAKIIKKTVNTLSLKVKDANLSDFSYVPKEFYRYNLNVVPKTSIPLNRDWNWLLIDNQSENLLRNAEEALGDELIADNSFPSKDQIFEAFRHCSFNNLKVVILGQDPYPTKGNAHGLAFSVNMGVKIPASLRNIYGALDSDSNVTFTKPNHGNLVKWAEQGVLLLNASLTVKEGKAGSDLKIWSPFTDRVIEQISDKCNNVVFVLWGRKAQMKKTLIDEGKHKILEYNHPSPMIPNNTFSKSCKHFSQINEYLKSVDRDTIDWRLT